MITGAHRTANTWYEMRRRGKFIGPPTKETHRLNAEYRRELTRKSRKARRPQRPTKTGNTRLLFMAKQPWPVIRLGASNVMRWRRGGPEPSGFDWDCEWYYKKTMKARARLRKDAA